MDHDALLIGGQITLAVACIGILALLCSAPADAMRLSARQSAGLILGGAILLQGSAVLMLWPALSEDLIRYRIDGVTWLAGYSPYALSPAQWDSPAFNGEPPHWDEVDRLGLSSRLYPELHTIYLPVSELIFVGTRGIERLFLPPPNPSHGARGATAIASGGAAPSTWRDAMGTLSFWQRGTVLRIIFAAAAATSALLLIRILTQTGKSPLWSIPFAWNPLTTLECGGMGHQDIIGILLILAAIHLLQNRKNIRAGVGLALACGVKPFAVVLLPFALGDGRKRTGDDSNNHHRLRQAAMLPLTFAVTLFILALPLLQQHGYIGWLATVRMYAHHWEANGSIYLAFKHFFGQGGDGWAMVHAKEHARQFAGASVVVVLGLCWFFKANIAQAGYWCLLAALLTAPVVYPWYLLWALALVPLLGGRTGWTMLIWSGTAAISYLLWRQPTWNLPTWATYAEYGPVYAMLIGEIAALLYRALAGWPMPRLRIT